jgi:chemotaxis methyl-accepting protein methylase
MKYYNPLSDSLFPGIFARFIISLALYLGILSTAPGAFAEHFPVDKKMLDDTAAILDLMESEAANRPPSLDALSKKLLDAGYPPETAIPFVCDAGRILVLYQRDGDDSILARLSGPRPGEAFHHETYPEKGALFAPARFDRWILSRRDLFERVTSNRAFLLRWIPLLPDNRESLPLSSLKSYLFRIDKPQHNYTLAAVIQEDRYFPDITEDDRQLYFLHCPLLHYTISETLGRILYCKIDDPVSLANLMEWMESYWPEPEQRLFFKKAFRTKLEALNENSFRDESFLRELKSVLENISQKYDFSNIPKKHLPALVSNMRNFLLSNGISSFRELKNSGEALKLEIADRFYSAKTTAFFRDWREMVFLKNWLHELDERRRTENRSIRIKVYGCSTGQEVLSYAIELLEMGIDNFRILASDIDPKVLAEAQKMVYSPYKFQTMPSGLKRQIQENYFEKNPEGMYQIRYPTFFRERIHFILQDITRPLEPDLPEEYAPPYDLISVKNILLYLEKNFVEHATGHLKNLLSPLGILIIRDKRNKASQFLFDPFDRHIGLTDYMIMREPDPPDEASVLRALELFDDPMPPQLLMYFDEYARDNRLRRVEKAVVDRLEKSDPQNAYAQETRFNRALDSGDSEAAWQSILDVCETAPLRFSYLFYPFMQKFPGHPRAASDSSYRDIFELFKLLSDPSGPGIAPDHIEARVRKLKKHTLPLHARVILAQILAGIDLSRFSDIESTENGAWIRSGIEILSEKNASPDPVLLLDHRIRLVNRFLQFFPSPQTNENPKYTRAIVSTLEKVPAKRLSLAGRISAGKLCCLHGSLAADENEKRRCYNRALELCSFDRDQLLQLTDTWYDEYFSVICAANKELAGLPSTSPDPETRLELLRNALKALEKSMAVKTVYGFQEINLRKVLKQKIRELSPGESEEN